MSQRQLTLPGLSRLSALKALARRPFTWMVVGEAVVVVALVAAAWHVYAQGRPDGAVTPAYRGPGTHGPSAGTASGPRPPSPEPTPTPAGAGRSTGIGIPFDIAALNRDQANYERAEAAVVRALIEAIRNYLERVVKPAVERAERGASPTHATTAARAHSPAAAMKIP